MKKDLCYCCSSPLAPLNQSVIVEVAQCRGCGSLLSEYPPAEAREADPWHIGNLTPSFLQALEMRRAKQAQRITAHFGKALRRGKLLDYGCGQGAFVSYVRSQGIDGKGCDISTRNLSPEIASHFVQVSEPWEIPPLGEFTSISFLDVLEHIDSPDIFVGKLAASGIDQVLIKVPMLRGPIGMFAHWLARRGKVGLLHRLLLVDEPAPHYSFFTSKGLVKLFASSGFRLVDSVRIADVGLELPNRLRGMQGEPSLSASRAITTAVGLGLAMISPLWSDTRVFLFQRSQGA